LSHEKPLASRLLLSSKSMAVFSKAWFVRC
jgi:hypothetical protein